MRFKILLLLCIISCTFSYAQIHEIGIFAGGSNFIGDVGSTNYISPNKPAFGGIYKWNRSPRHSYRFSIILSELEGVDANSDDPRRIQRNYSFTNNIVELSAGIEFSFVDFNLHEGGKLFTPYLYGGLTLTNFDEFYINNGNIISADEKKYTLGIPMTIGFKTRVSTQLIFGVEIGARYSLTDQLDGNYPDSSNLFDLYSFGNTNNNDWYMFTGATLTYTFGRKPCYCDY